MKILSRYLLREHLAPFAFAFGALTGLLVLNQLARQFSSLVGKGLGWGVIGQVFILSVPYIIAMTIPMAVLVAVLHAFSRLGADNEITALKASGVDLGRLVRPILAATFVLAIAVFAFLDQVLPRTNHSLKDLLLDIGRKRPTFELKEQMVNEVVPQSLFLRAGRIDQATDRLKDVVIYDLGNDARRRTIYADSGHMRFNADRTDLYLTLYDGYIHDYDRLQSNVFRRIFFKTDLVSVRHVSNTLERNTEDAFAGEREMTLCQMEAEVVKWSRAQAHAQVMRRYSLSNDARSLLDAPMLMPPTDSTSHRHSATQLYCALLGKVNALLHPAAARAQNPPPAHPAPAASVAVPPLVRGAAPASAPQQPIVRAGQVAVTPPGPPPLISRQAPDPSGTRLKGELLVNNSERKTTLQQIALFAVEIHKKYSIAASCLVFVLIGAPVALRFPRGGVGLVIGASVFIFGFYYVGLIGGETLADALIISPFWAMWGPNLLMVAIGLFLFMRLGYEHATARSGGWGERFRTLGGKLLFWRRNR